MKYLPEVKGKFDSLLDVLDKKVWVKGSWAVSGVHGDAKGTGAYDYFDSIHYYTGDDCQGVCAVGALDMYLGAHTANQSVIDFDIDVKDPNHTVSDRLIDWYDSVLVKVGNMHATNVFMSWKDSYFTDALLDSRQFPANYSYQRRKITRECVLGWTEIPHMNDNEYTTLQDIQDLLGTIDLYPPFSDVVELRRESLPRRYMKSRQLYTKWVKPYMADNDIEGWGTSSISPQKYLELLKQANYL